LNGQFVPASEAVVSAFDRGFLYGDGLFETLRVYCGRPFRWTKHLERLEGGAACLHLRLPYSADELKSAAEELIRRNQMPEAVLRLAVSRGPGERGYSIAGAARPTVVMSLHPAASLAEADRPRWRLLTSSWRVAVRDRLGQFKTSCRLVHVLARAEAELAGADEALLLDTDGQVVEAAGSNLFWIQGGVVCTVPLEAGALPGVTRSIVLELCAALPVAARQVPITPPRLLQADAVFLSLSTWGLVEAASLDGQTLGVSPLVQTLHQRYQALVAAESAA
jgi:aminodeoxychorismate lyase